MKKYILSLSLFLTCLTALAQDFEYEYEGTTLTYTVIDEGAKTCKLKEGTFDGWKSGTPGNNVSGDIVIPSKANGYHVIEIPQFAFIDCKNFTSVTIPNSITTINRGAFTNCIYEA